MMHSTSTFPRTCGRRSGPSGSTARTMKAPAPIRENVVHSASGNSENTCPTYPLSEWFSPGT